jgi:uncharacterized protein
MDFTGNKLAIYFIDSNIFIYAIGKDHPLKPGCIALIQKIRSGKITAVISTEIIQEILYRFQSIKSLPAGIELSQEAIQLSSIILPVTETDLSRAIDILETSPAIQTRDAFHAAVMLNNDLQEIISTDAHFDLISGIRRLDPGRE